METYCLMTKFDSRNSFYNKAIVIEDVKSINRKEITLFSYCVKVATITTGLPNGEREVIVFDDYSQTTLRHIKEFLKQHGFKAETKKQILNDYRVKG